MSNVSAAHDFFNGDTAPEAPSAGFVSLFFLNNILHTRRPGGAAIPLAPQWSAQLSFAGECVADALFDRHQPGPAVYVTRLEATCQEAPAGGGLVIELVDSTGASFTPARTVTIADGTNHAVADITDLALASGASVRGKLSTVPATPGGWVTLRLSITPQ